LPIAIPFCRDSSHESRFAGSQIQIWALQAQVNCLRIRICERVNPDLQDESTFLQTSYTIPATLIFSQILRAFLQKKKKFNPQDKVYLNQYPLSHNINLLDALGDPGFLFFSLRRVSTCISTISKFNTIQYRLNFLFQKLIRNNIDRISYIEIQNDTNIWKNFRYRFQSIISVCASV
jgi:hypothetical protein